MKSPLLLTAIVAGVLSVICLTMAGERAVATGNTWDAIKVIESGMDWDQITPITTSQQAERMEANLNILQTQVSGRNTWGILGLVSSLVTIGAAFGIRSRRKSG